MKKGNRIGATVTAKRLALGLLATGIIIGNTASAVSYSFENSWDGWSTTGNVSLVENSEVDELDSLLNFGVNAKTGSYQARIEAVGEGTSNGSTLALANFTAGAGSVLTFAWWFAAGDVLDGYRGDDFAYYILDGVTTRLMTISQIPYDEETIGYTPYYTTPIYISNDRPTHSLVFGVANHGDDYNPSWLFIDDVTISSPAPAPHPVPESSVTGAWLLTMAGLCGAQRWLTRRRMPETPALEQAA